MALGAIGALVMVGALYGDSGGSRPSTAVSLAVLVMLLYQFSKVLHQPELC